MMNKKGEKAGLILIPCAMLFISLVLLVLVTEHKRLNREFDTLVGQNLSSYTHMQRNQIIDQITDVENTLAAISRLVESPEFNPGGRDLKSVLENLESGDEGYQIGYLSVEVFREEYLEGRGQTEETELFEQLEHGTAAVSDIRYFARDGAYYFAILQPVVKDGKNIGLLRVWVNADRIDHASQENALYQNVYTCIINHKGDILYTNAKQYQTTGNLFTSTSANGLSDEVARQLHSFIDSHQDITYQVELDQAAFFVSTGRIDSNDWDIVNFLRSSDVLFRSDAIFERMIGISMFLILLTAVISGVMVTTFLRQKRRFNLEVQRYSLLAQFSDTILFEYDYKTDSIEFTPNAQRRLAIRQLKLEHILSGQEKLDIFHPDDWQVLLKMIREAPADTRALSYCELRLKELDGGYCWYGCQNKYIFSGETPALVISKLVDITERRTREQELLEQMQRDVLTDTYNKSGEAIINKILNRKKRGLFFMIDLDDFKAVNDTYGHAAGDALLSSIGNMLKNIFRENDIVARIGGDEFVVFVGASSDKKLAERKAVMIEEKINALQIDGFPELHASVSIGIAICPQDGGSYQELYHAADQAMYAVKHGAKRGHRFYAP